MTAQQVTPLALALWARKFATLIGAGTSLVRVLEIVEATSDQPLQEVTRELKERITAGATLSDAMQERPDVFERLAVFAVRAGEIGGVLDETMAAWADWLETELRWHTRYHTHVLLAQALGLARTREEADEQLAAAVPDLRERAREFAYCEMAGMMLSSGVPLAQALQVASEALADEPERAEALAKAAQERGGELHHCLAEAGFSPITCNLVAVGQETGQLARMLHMAAEVLQHELETKMTVALSGLHEGIEEKGHGG